MRPSQPPAPMEMTSSGLPIHPVLISHSTFSTDQPLICCLLLHLQYNTWLCLGPDKDLKLKMVNKIIVYIYNLSWCLKSMKTNKKYPKQFMCCTKHQLLQCIVDTFSQVEEPTWRYQSGDQTTADWVNPLGDHKMSASRDFVSLVEKVCL